MSTILIGVIGKWDWNLNDILVFSTVIIFVFIVCACSLMWTTRPAAKKEGSDFTALPERQRSSWAANQFNDIGNGNVSGKSKHSAASSKSKDKKKSKKKNERLQDLEGGTPDSSNPSLEAESLLGGRVLGLDVDATPGPPSQGDSVLAQTLLSVLSQGMILMIYNEKGAKQANVTLVGGSELHWRTAKLFSKKGKQLNLREVLFVNWGKQTTKFHLPSSKIAVDDCCFSLVTSNYTLDFEASSKVERDALAQGFTILLTRFREKRPVEEVSWNSGSRQL